MGHRAAGAAGHGARPPRAALRTGWWCLQHHRSCRARGRGGSHTETPAAGTRRRTPLNIHSCTRGPPGPDPTLSPVLPSPRPEELYCFERATLGAALPGTLPPTPILAHLQDTRRRGWAPSLPGLCGWELRKRAGDFIRHLSPSPSQTPSKPTPARTHPTPPKHTHTHKAELPGNRGTGDCPGRGQRRVGRKDWKQRPRPGVG